MADRNSYLRYKRDTTHLLYWMIHASNTIIKSAPPDLSLKEAVIKVNTTGQLSVSALVPLSSLIAKHISPIPSTIYRLFESVIAARTATHDLFTQLVTVKPDPDTEKSNNSHRAFINALTGSLEVLGGAEWAERQKSKATDQGEEDRDEVVLANQFSTLGLEVPNGEEEADYEVEDETAKFHNRPVKKGNAKGKKGKRGKKAKTKQPTKDDSLDDIPLESYRIIEDETGVVTEYLIAVYSLVQEWGDLRHYVQGLWGETAYSGLNSAVAGTMSNLALGMIKKTESSIFVDFPGHDSYETVMNTITRGDPEKAQGQFHLDLHRVDSSSGSTERVHQVDVDIKEEFMIYCYRDLLDFIQDFQKTRSGKPTKPILAEIANWDPNFDLQRANKEERIKWRRAYTINWLYDLVNVYSGVVVQRINIKKQKWVLETVDWSIHGPWDKHRVLFGLNEFAGQITSFAMQKPSTDIRHKILPHHVFQLQCIVDSLAVSRGWAINSFKGHVVKSPAQGFRPRRDADLFLDRDNERTFHGYLQGVDMLVQLFEKDAMLHEDPKRHLVISELLKDLNHDFIDWFAETKYISGLNTIAPSRFSSTNPNGLWEYSPFLCGVGLVEALELVYAIGFMVWDRIPEPICLVHLHNMLVQKGYISRAVGLFSSLETLFTKSFFANGKVPVGLDADFSSAFLETISQTTSRRAKYERRSIRRNAARTSPDIHGLLDMNANNFFKQKSLLRVYREAGWNPERIPDDDIPLISSLGMLRLGRAKIIVDPVTGKKAMENTPWVERARQKGIDDTIMVEMASMLQDGEKSKNKPISEAVRALLPEGYTESSSYKNPAAGGALGRRSLLNLLKIDVISDISGINPISSLNYIWVAARFMGLFHQIESKLEDLRNPTWVHAYETDATMMREKRFSLTASVLTEQDEECMEVIAEAFQDPRIGFMNHIYWEDLQENYGPGRDVEKIEDEMDGECAVM